MKWGIGEARERSYWQIRKKWDEKMSKVLFLRVWSLKNSIRTPNLKFIPHPTYIVTWSVFYGLRSIFMVSMAPEKYSRLELEQNLLWIWDKKPLLLILSILTQILGLLTFCFPHKLSTSAHVQCCVLARECGEPRQCWSRFLEQSNPHRQL